VIVLAKGIGTNMEQILSKRKTHIILSAAYAAVGDMSSLKKELTDALDDGFTISELREILMHCYAYCGFPRALNGIGALMTVLKEREENGIKDTEGAAAEILPEGTDKNLYGKQTREELTGVRPTAAYALFAPGIDDFLKEHLFCDLFSRGILTREERELVTISVIATLPGAEAQLRTHTSICQSQGFTEEETVAWRKLIDEKVLRRPLFGIGVENTGNAAYFSGQSFANVLVTDPMRVTNVTFEPGCRNNWHIHHKGGQILLCTEGNGWYQAEGEAPQKLTPGDVVNIPAEVKHWHGAAKDSRFVHVALSVPAEGASVEWLEPVTDEDYKKIINQKCALYI
jgi:4-carboxymuconolactone decarboxylase